MAKVKFTQFSERRYQALADTLRHGVDQKVAILKQDPVYGDCLAKRLIPRELRTREISTLFRVELPGYWRMLYTITDEDQALVVIALAIVDHKEYDKLFGYRKK